MNNDFHLQKWFVSERDLNEMEIEVLTSLMSRPFKERSIIVEQLRTVKVNGRCTCECLTINLKGKQVERKISI